MAVPYPAGLLFVISFVVAGRLKNDEFHQTKDLKISDEIYRLTGELMKLDEAWMFRP